MRTHKSKSDQLRFGDGIARLPTYFAPSHRADKHEVTRAIKALGQHQLVSSLLDATGVILMVLNDSRQVLVANVELLRAIGARSVEEVEGYRPGEILDCDNAWKSEAGCGTAAACKACGATIAILQSIKSNAPAESECLMNVRRDGELAACEFRVKVTPLRLDGETFYVASMRDISDEKRRDTLEQVFLHDILNTIGGLSGWSQIIKHLGSGETRNAAQRIAFLGERLRKEVLAHRDITLAESGQLQLEIARVRAIDILNAVSRTFEEHDVAKDRSLEISCEASIELSTDATLLERVILNMVKNALEACSEGATVRIRCRQLGGGVRFEVHNSGAMSATVALQVFKRNFSTKETPGHGLGTYSMKLFGERYLGGKVGFESEKEAGTTFFVELPTRIVNGSGHTSDV